MSKNNVFLQIDKLTKNFPGVKALSDVDFTVNKGEVHALVGENGAGKSTLIKILGGVYRPDSGDIYLDGKKVTIANTRQAKSNKIAVIYQEFYLIPDLSVAENIFVGREPRILGKTFINWRKMNSDAKKILDRLGIDIDCKRFVLDLSVAERQMVEIAKALSVDARLFIMDEPTASLTEKEVVKLFEIIDELKRQGVSIIYISHRDQGKHRTYRNIKISRHYNKGHTYCTNGYIR